MKQDGKKQFEECSYCHSKSRRHKKWCAVGYDERNRKMVSDYKAPRVKERFIEGLP